MEEIKLKDICDLDNGYAFKSDDYIEESSTLNCRMSNIRPDGSFDIHYNAKYLPDEFAEKYKEYILNDGDLIIAMTDMADDPKILGVPTVVDTQGYKLLLNQRVGRLRFIKDGINADYLKLALQCPKVRDYLKMFAGGGVQLNVSKKDILNSPVHMRSIEEQNKIADVFRRVQKIINQREIELKSLDELIKARFVEMFNTGEYPLVSISELVVGKVPSVKKAFSPKDEIKYIDISSIDNKRNVMTGYTEYVLSDAPSRAQQHIQKGDIVVSTVRPNLKNVAITSFDDNNLVASSGFCVLRAEKCLPEYLLAIVCSDKFTEDMTRVVTGANYPAIKDSDVMNYQVAMAPMDLQVQFADFVKQADKSKNAAQKSLEETQLLFDSLMQEYFG